MQGPLVMVNMNTLKCVGMGNVCTVKVNWCHGAMVPWCNGAMVQCVQSQGELVHWYNGTMVQSQGELVPAVN